MALVNGKSISVQEPDLIIERRIHARLGSCLQGCPNRGSWSWIEHKHHIKYLELLAAMLAVKTFTKSQENLYIHLRMDNRTAVFLCEQGGKDPFSNNEQASNPAVAMVFEVEPVPVSRVSTRTRKLHSRQGIIQSSAEWKLEGFQQIMGECSVDLFASQLSAQLEQYMSWRADPNAMATDAFQIQWNKWMGYAFLLFCLIAKCIKRVREDKALLVLVAPIWWSQLWYPALLDLLVDYPLILPESLDLQPTAASCL